MPKIWAATIDTHRRQVTDAILDATAELVVEAGPLSVGMSAVAERAGIGRATLYKYFPDLESILVAWHEREFATSLDQLRALSEAENLTLERVVEFVCTQRHRHSRRHGSHVVGSRASTLASTAGLPEGAIEREIVGLLTALLTRLAQRGNVRDDQDPELLARWLVHAGHADLDHRAVTQLVVDALKPRPRRRR